MEHEMDDWALLRDYVEGRSEAAFAELVQRHADLVYSSALRQTGDPHLAGDVAQAVFLSLARKSATISRAAVIAGWLVHATRRESANLLRDRARRSRREQLAVEMHSPTPNSLDAAWERVAPLLDEGLATLRETDRDAVVLHFLRRRTFREVGESLGLSEEAARKRVTRALDSLHTFLTGRGVSLPHTTLAAALVAFSVQPAPQAVAAAIVSAIGAGGAVSTGLLTLYKTIQFMAWTKTKTAIVAVVALAAVPLGLQWQENRELRRQVGELQAALQQRPVERAPSNSPPTVSDESTPRPGVATANMPAQPARTVREIMRQALALTTSGKSREEAVKEIEPLLAQIPVSDLREAANQALAITDHSWRMGFLYMLLGRWARTDGSAAVAYLVENVKGDAQLPLLAGVIPSWAERDPESAWSWFQTSAREQLNFDARGMHNSALKEMFAAMGRSDFDRSLSRALELQGIDLCNAHLGLTESSQTLNQRLRLIAQADVLPDASMRDEVRKSILSTWAGAHPSEVRAYVEGLTDPGSRSETARQAGAGLMASLSPVDAADWWLQQTTESDRPGALADIIRRWSEIDLVGAADWLGKQGNGPETDAAKAAFAVQAMQRAPNAAMDWANTISDQTRRLQIMRDVYRIWSGQNPGAAQTWLASSGLPQNQQEAVRPK